MLLRFFSGRTVAAAALVALSVCACATPAHSKTPPEQSDTSLPQPVSKAIERAGLPPSAVSIIVQQVGLDDTAVRAAQVARQKQWESTRLRAGKGLHKGVYSTTLSLPDAPDAHTPTPAALPAPVAHQPLINHHANVQRNPASVMKLITTYAALDALGTDFRWYNRVYHTGSIRNGTLNGDLIIRGSGDPKLVLERIADLFAAIRKKGIRHIRGDIILDRSVFRTPEKDPGSFDGQPLRAYNASPDGLLFNFKSVIFTFDPDTPPQTQAIARTATPAPGTAGQTVSVPGTAQLTVRNSNNPGSQGTPNAQRVNLTPNRKQKTPANGNSRRHGKSNHIAVQYEPPIAGVRISPSVRLRSSRNCGNWKSSLRADFSDPTDIRFSGSFPSGCGLRYWPIAYPDTDSYAPRVAAAMWHRAGGSASGTVRYGKRPARARELLRKPSLPMQTIITDINRFSNNVMADQVFLSLPVYSQNKPPVYTGSYAQSRQWIQDWWRRTLPEAAQPSYVENGSGLSRLSRVSASSLNALLQHANDHHSADAFVQSLGVAGVTGTIAKLKSRNPDSAAIGRAFIKTGTLNSVRSIAGYVDGQSGRRYALVALINHHHAGRSKPVLDALLDWTARQ